MVPRESTLSVAYLCGLLNLDVGRRLVEGVERLVCTLYGLPDPLTNLVVESAIARAGTVAENEE